MKRIAFDTETELLEPGNVSPRLVCLSLARSDGGSVALVGRKVAPTLLESYLASDDLLIGQNVAFDFGVIGAERPDLVPAIFEAYEANRIRDTQIREKLIAIREGRPLQSGFSLDDLSQKYLKIPLDKGAESVRYRYGELIDTPIDQWPDNFKTYAKTDALITLRVHDSQANGGLVSPDEHLQTRAAWCLHLSKMWGLRTDPIAVNELGPSLEEQCARAQKELLEIAFYKIGGTKKAPKLVKDTKAIAATVTEAYKGKPPLTETGRPCMDEDTLRESGHPKLIKLANAAGAEKLRNTFLPLVRRGTEIPINPGWITPMATGRTACGGDSKNWQNLPREGGIRECVIPRPGHLFVKADYAQLELCTLAQVLLDFFGASELAKAIQAGRDLHLDLAVSTPLLLGDLTYEQAKALRKAGNKRVEDKRQFAKVMNFGFPGGLGPTSLVSYARAMAGITVTEEEAYEGKQAWLRKWPEMRGYFNRITRITEGRQPITQIRSGRIRGGVEFCAAANSYFQGLAADGAKAAMWEITKRCYLDPKSALFESRMILFIHDEFILETPIERASAAGDELAAVMVEEMQRWTPQIPIKAEPAIMERWQKDAKETRDANGKLTVWRPAAPVAA